MAIDRQRLFSGTESPPKHLALDVPALAAYLSDKVDGLGAAFTVEKFKGGQSNPTYKLTNPQADVSAVLRRRPPGQLLASAHDIQREYRVISALARTGFPVPHPYHYCANESVIGSSFYVVSYSAGRIFWEADIPGTPAPERAAIHDDMVARLAELHGLDYRALGFEDLGRAGHYAERNFARWSKVYEQSKLVDIPDMDWLMRRLPALMPREERVSLLHGDYGLYNIVIDPRRPRVNAVLDWEMSTLGDPFVDLAHHLRAWWEPVDEVGGAASSLRGKDLAALGIPTMDDYIAKYCRRLGIAELPHRGFYLGYAQFRYAAMIQGILKRAAIGTTSNRAVLHRQERVFEVAALARATLEGRTA
ncbi:MAG: phosphotransferase family protein [Aromatoleum sp.]|jgi:aminoglycoside phosphotransferase (APT) family kinase protein|uniref:phosphotransferase family protein n=1 Tax=Aromatoleum sp. TaxID=2307007 RepID=UPI0028951F6F|nr:phosphotransferase family protein [Aromatoleum sp.]MDT3670196.1 phosphotransferase family protein [Aromatoleum sp.]